MDESELSLTIDELARRVDVPVRTVRFYITQGLLPGPGTRGRAASYGEEQLLRLRLVRQLVARRVPLEEIRDRLREMPLDDVRALLAEEERRAARETREERKLQAGQGGETTGKSSPKDYVATLLRRAGYPEQKESQPATLPPPAPDSARLLPSPGPGSATQAPPSLESPVQAPAPRQPESWRRWELAPGVEIHVRADVSDRYRELIERILRAVQDTRPRWPKR